MVNLCWKLAMASHLKVDWSRQSPTLVRFDDAVPIARTQHVHLLAVSFQFSAESVRLQASLD